MMRISLSDVGKRFNREWIFKNFSYTFNSDQSYAIVGPNGSGKSTLLQVIGGAIALSTGNILYHPSNSNGNASSGINHDDVFRHISITAPYLEVIEEMTVTEFLNFHQEFKPLMQAMSIDKIISTIGLQNAAHKQIRYYSSGMKQRVKLAQAFFSDTPCLLLDEPCTNLDQEGVELYHELIRNYANDRLVIVSSNDVVEYSFCRNIISIMEYK